MTSGEYKPIASQAAEEYRRRLSSLNTLQARDRQRERAFGIAKLVVAALAIASSVLLIRHFLFGGITAALIVLFIVLAIRHEKLLQAMRHRGRILAFYERGMARLEDRWQGGGEGGERFLDPAHPYARDLDIFGRASLFEYLSVARTSSGEETLARWLLHPAAPDQIAARQSAVKELQGRADLREKLASAGEAVREGVQPDAMARWGESEPAFTSTRRRVLTTALALLWFVSLAAWAVWGKYEWAVLSTVLNFAYAHLLFRDAEPVAAALENSTADLLLLAEVLALFEKESFAPGRLADLQASLQTGGIRASQAVRKLARIVDPLEGRHSLIAHPIDLVTYWSAQLIFLAERWRRRFGPSIRTWIDVVGELEALASLSAFAFEHPAYAFPVITEAAPCYFATDLAHPLLPLNDAVANDVALSGAARILILSGPNMAGKSTFIRALGVNAVLAQCGAPVCARTLRMSPLQVAASICVLDSLSGGVSRFYAEIGRIKLIADLAGGAMPVLFLLDELLSGTNSHDRFIATRFVLQMMASRNTIGIVSTHDLALTKIAEEMPDSIFNAHFEDRIEGDRLIFDYKLKPGVVQTSNALHLMRAIGLRVKDSTA
ncbi:MAG: MutS-related protein [Acidobacteriota bacterium]